MRTENSERVRREQKPVPANLDDLESTPENLALLQEYLVTIEDRERVAVEVEGARFRQFENDPIGFVEKGVNGFLWSKQKEICLSVLHNRRTAVKSCHGPGKSFTAAQIAAWWISSHKPGHAFVVSSAPTFRQVKNILWREIGRTHRAGGLPGRVNLTEWYMGSEIVGFGAPPKDTDLTAFQGIHARYVLVLLDEACGVVSMLWEAAKTLVTNDDSRMVAIGNPDDPSAEFAKVCRPGSGWNVIQISAFGTPNFTDEPVPDELRHVLVSRVWVEERRAEWGEGSPLWIAKVLGEFPDDAVDGLIPYSALRAAVNRTLEPVGPVELGVDVARMGADSTVIYKRQGPVARLVNRFNGRDTMQVVGAVVQAIRATGATRVKVDDVGVGGGVIDRLQELKREELLPKTIQLLGINVGVTCKTESARERYFNLRSELHWGMRMRFLSGDIDIENDDKLLSQAASIRYSTNSRGQIVVESKDDMRERKLPSPDEFDAIMLAYAEPQFEGAGVLAWYAQEAEKEQRKRDAEDRSFTPVNVPVIQGPPAGF